MYLEPARHSLQRNMRPHTSTAFYDGIIDWIQKSVDEGFIHGSNANILVQATTAEDAVRALREYKVSPSVLKLAWGNE